MDTPNHSPNYTCKTPNPSRRSGQLEAAAMTLGLIAVISCTCLYISVPCGALAIILASLSRGGGMTYGSRAYAGIILGILAIIATAVLYGISLAIALREYGSLDAFMKAFSNSSGIDYNDLMQQLMPSTQTL